MATHRVRIAVSVAVAAALALTGCSEDIPEQPTAGDHYNPNDPPKAGDPLPSQSASSSSTPPPSSGASTSQAGGTTSTGGSGAPNSSPTGQLTVTATSTPPPPPDAAGAIKVVRDYLAAYNKASRNPALVAGMDKYTLPSCRACAALRQNIGAFAANKQHAANDTVSLGRHRAQQEGGPDQAAVLGHMPQRASDIVDASGRKVGRLEADNTLYRAFELRRVGGVWKISAIKKLVGGL